MIEKIIEWSNAKREILFLEKPTIFNKVLFKIVDYISSKYW